MVIIKNTIVTLNIFYWMPDYEHLLQQFIWQTKDIVPGYPRVHKFLNFWYNNIDATIAEIKIANEDKTDYRPVKEVFNMH